MNDGKERLWKILKRVFSTSLLRKTEANGFEEVIKERWYLGAVGGDNKKLMSHHQEFNERAYATRKQIKKNGG